MGQVWLGTLLMPFNQSHGNDSGVSNIAMTLPPNVKKTDIPYIIVTILPNDLSVWDLTLIFFFF